MKCVGMGQRYDGLDYELETTMRGKFQAVRGILEWPETRLDRTH